MRSNKHLFLGRAGQLYVVAEFLLHHWNAAIPEVDTGDDVFVVRDKIGEFKRIQVKTVTAVKRTYGYSVQFLIPYTQLISPINPELVYFLVIRFDNSWNNYLVIERFKLQEYVTMKNIGKMDSKKINIQLYFKFDNKSKKVVCDGEDFSSYFQDWSIFQ